MSNFWLQKIKNICNIFWENKWLQCPFKNTNFLQHNREDVLSQPDKEEMNRFVTF